MLWNTSKINMHRGLKKQKPPAVSILWFKNSSLELTINNFNILMLKK